MRKPKKLENDIIQSRRAEVLTLHAKGLTQKEIAEQLKVTTPTINKDLSALKEQAHERIKTFVEDIIPQEHQKTVAGIEAIIKEAWEIARTADEQSVALAALKVAHECYTTKLNVISDATVLDRAREEKLALQKKIAELQNPKPKSAGPVKAVV